MTISKAEKFIEDYTRHCSNVVAYSGMIEGSELRYHEWLTPDQARSAVEIAKEEMIKKACKYLDLHCNEVKTEDNGIVGWIDNEFITNFRKAMKDE